MRYRFYTIMLSVLLALPLLGSEVDGTWMAAIETPRGAQEISFTFQTDGEDLTGTVGGMRGHSEIEDGKVEGNDFSFKQKANFRDREMVILYTGTVSGDEIRMTRQVEGFGDPREFTAKRK